MGLESLMGNQMISVKNVNMSFLGVRQLAALENINFDVNKKEFICILGPSGCGKTTLLNLMGGFLKPTSGEIIIDGKPVEKPSPKYLTIFQDYKLLPWRSVRKNIELGLEVAKLSKDEVNRRVNEQMKTVGLTDFADYRPSEISGGMKQRVAIARALVLKPKILFMDEPFGALDALTRDDMKQYFRSLLKETGQTVIMVTHNVSEAIYFADKIIIMQSQPGRIASIMDVELPEERDIFTPEFHAIRTKVYDSLNK